MIAQIRRSRAVAPSQAGRGRGAASAQTAVAGGADRKSTGGEPRKLRLSLPGRACRFGVAVRVVSMRVVLSVLSANGRSRAVGARAVRHFAGCIGLIAGALLAPSTPASAEHLNEALVRTYQGNPQLNA